MIARHNISYFSVLASSYQIQSLAAAASPTSATNLYLKESQTLGGTSGSDSDSDSLLDIEGGPCEQSTNPQDVKRMRRYTKNMNNVFFSIFLIHY